MLIFSIKYIIIYLVNINNVRRYKIMEKTVVELFAGVGGFRCGLNKVELIKNKVKENMKIYFKKLN